MSHSTRQVQHESQNITKEADNLYTIFSIADQLTQEIAQAKAEKIKFLKEQYEMGIEPDSLEIARAIGKYLKKLS